MKKILLLIFIGVLVAGCSGIQLYPQPVKPVCPPPVDPETGVQKLSWICQQSAKVNVAPENIEDFIFDASVAAVLSGVERMWLCDFTKEIKDWYVAHKPVSYNDILQEVIRQMKLIDDPDKLLLISTSLNRKLRMYASPQLVQDYDDWMLGVWMTRYRGDMMCPD